MDIDSIDFDTNWKWVEKGLNAILKQQGDTAVWHTVFRLHMFY